MIHSFDPLMQTMLERATVPSSHTTTPPADKRYDTAQKMMGAYQNNWSPNPILIRLMEGRHGS